jgi:hypothetical protein
MFYRGIEFEVAEVSRFKWQWTIYQKKSLHIGTVTREVDTTTRKHVIAQCKIEIDRKLERKQHA